MLPPEKKQYRGFSIVEMLVVIAVIGILATIVLAAMSKARAQGRDAKRKTTLTHLQLAITEYYDSANANTTGVKVYPSTGGAWYSSESGDVNPNGLNNNGDWIPGLAPNFIDALPKDPRGGASTICPTPWKASYHYRSDGVSYKLLSHCSPEGTWDSKSPLYDPVRPTWAWMVCAGATACATW